MGLFDLFKGGAKSAKGDKGAKSDGKSRAKGSPAAKWADRVEKRVQNYDRQEAIQALSEMGTAEAVTVLLKRFTFHMDPSITDQEEKDAAFRGVLRAGKEAVEPVRTFAARAESLAWPMKIIKELSMSRSSCVGCRDGTRNTRSSSTRRCRSSRLSRSTDTRAFAKKSSASSRTSTSRPASTPHPRCLRKTILPL
jgi:hypothetical protein